jgi:hypothetical protein
MRSLLVFALAFTAGCHDRDLQHDVVKLSNDVALLTTQRQQLEAELAATKAALAAAQAVPAPPQNNTAAAQNNSDAAPQNNPSAAAQDTPAALQNNSAPRRALAQAQDAYVRGDFSHAKTLARVAVAVEPSRAWRLIGASGCFLKDQRGVEEAAAHLSAQERRFLRYVCGRNGVSLRL